MVFCCAVGCTSNTKKECMYKFFRIPKARTSGDPEVVRRSKAQREKWISKIKRADLVVTEHTRLCSRHFISGKPANYMQTTDIDWAPSQHLGYSEATPVDVSLAVGRVERQRQREQKRIEAETVDPVLEDREPTDDEVDQLKTFSSVSCQTELTMEDIEYLDQLRKDFTFTEDCLKEDDVKVQFYTGLPSFQLVLSVFTLVSNFININSSAALFKFEEFFLVLMRLRLNLLEEDLAYRFRISQSTVSRIMDRWLPVMADCLRGLLVWPDRETLWTTMPECFKKAFGNSVIAILDCFEIFIDAPSDLEARAITWSQYKHHNTVKILICITPQGTISYISCCWGGRTSDVHITENSEFLENLIPGDIILADRGFDIGQILGQYRARVVMPSFTHGKPQLSGRDLEESQETSNVRIHVERLIGFMRRKFRVFQGPLHWSFLRHPAHSPMARIDHIVTICAALVNLCPPIVPMEDV